MSTNVVKMKRHDTRPFLDIKLKDSDTEYADLTISGIAVTFTMKDFDTDVIKVSAQSCEILTPIEGAVRYVWQPEDTDTVGTYLGEFEVTYPAEEPYPDAKTTYPISSALAIVILEDYDDA